MNICDLPECGIDIETLEYTLTGNKRTHKKTQKYCCQMHSTIAQMERKHGADRIRKADEDRGRLSSTSICDRWLVGARYDSGWQE